MTLVSIIIPVYNVEKYLARCLDSCLNQSFADIEIICVNDGSEDSSPDILNHYQKFDSRIKIINKSNGGLSSARNAGISQAQGKYILFVDSDDYISTIAVEKLYDNAQRNQSDVVIFDYISGGADMLSQKIVNKSQFLSEYENKPFNETVMRFAGYKFTPPTAWSKLYRTDLIKDKISFCEGIIFEDNPFWAEVYLSAKRITYLPTALYYYLINRQGRIMQTLDENVFDIFKVHECIKNTFINHGLYNKYETEVNLLKVMDYIRNYHRIEPGLKKEFYNRICQDDIRLDCESILNGKYLDIEKAYVKYFQKLKELDYADFQKVRLGEIK